MALVCLCHGVNERRIVKEIERGACSVFELAEACGAGSCCMGCHPTLDQILAEKLPANQPAPASRLRWKPRVA